MGLAWAEKKSVIANVVVDIYTPTPYIERKRDSFLMIALTHTLDGSSLRQSEQIVSTWNEPASHSLKELVDLPEGVVRRLCICTVGRVYVCVCSLAYFYN